VVAVTQREHYPGGGANTAVNVRSLGAHVQFLAVVGEDPEGYLLQQALEKNQVSTAHIIASPQRLTLAKQRVVSGSQLVVRFDQGSITPIEGELEAEFIRRLEELYPQADAVIVSDYAYGIITPDVLKTLKRLYVDDPHPLIIDSKRLPMYQELGVTAIKPNYAEAVQLLGLKNLPPAATWEKGSCPEEERICQIMEHGSRILEITGAQIAAITLDVSGALVFERDSAPYRTYARPQPHTRSAGAGDTFISAFALALAADVHTETAAEIASAAAAIVVDKDNTAVCYAEELHAYFSTGEKYVTDVFQLAAALNVYRRQGRRIVFTNGCFDILHRGHITYLNRAKSLGDVLVVGLNSDASVRRLKGPLRPINTQEDRAQVLAALSCVDHIVAFDSNTPHELIRIVKPDVFAKGGDYTRETLPEAPLVESLGGEVVILPYLEDRSTTSIIERIRTQGPAALSRLENRK
jgi:D-beta-D-heptose 7-phosphate kinase/D-beta-D-heptose 1-phosphate adenosyltransferase